CGLAAITLAKAGTDDAQISTLAVAITRRDGVEETLDRFAAQQISSSKTARSHIAALAQGNHLLDMRTHRLGFRHRGLDAFFEDERSHEVAQKGATMARVPA